MNKKVFATVFFWCFVLFAQKEDKIYSIIASVSAERIESDIRTLANFGTRHTLSDTLSNIRGIGAARRWIKNEFDKINFGCGGCLKLVIKKLSSAKWRSDCEASMDQ